MITRIWKYFHFLIYIHTDKNEYILYLMKIEKNKILEFWILILMNAVIWYYL